MSRFERGQRVLRYRGVGYLWYLFSGVLWPRVVYRRIVESDLLTGRSGRLLAVIGGVGAVTALVFLTRWSSGLGLTSLSVAAVCGSLIWFFRRRSAVRDLQSRLPLADADTGSTPELSQFLKDLPHQGEQGVTSTATSGAELLLGSFDNDGRLSSRFGRLPGTHEVSAAEFVQRYRFDLDLVLIENRILVKKHFRGSRAALRRERMSLSALKGRVNAPDIVRTRMEGTLLYKSFVPGSTVRDLLAEQGAKILSVETVGDSFLVNLSARERIEEVWRRGRELFSEALDRGFLTDLEGQVEQAHRCGVTGFSLTFGNVVVHPLTGRPWLIDFDSAQVHPSTKTMAFRRARDRDREVFNTIWGRSLMTERRAREFLSSLGPSYAPVDLGGGLVSRGFWSPDSGSGRWEAVNGPVLGSVIQGKRVLDLGSNNGVMSLMMVRENGSRVVAYERDKELVIQAHEMHRLFEWRDMRKYDVEFRQSDMRDVANEGRGCFDVVTAFCSLYYLEEEDMVRVAKAARGLAPIFVVQAKTDTRPEAVGGKAEKSSVEFLRGLLGECGFGRTEVHGPVGYSRPLIIATSN